MTISEATLQLLYNQKKLRKYTFFTNPSTKSRKLSHDSSHIFQTPNTANNTKQSNFARTGRITPTKAQLSTQQAQILKEKS